MDRLVPSATTNLRLVVAPVGEAPINSRHRHQEEAAATRRLSGQLGCTVLDIPTAHLPVTDPLIIITIAVIKKKDGYVAVALFGNNHAN